MQMPLVWHEPLTQAVPEGHCAALAQGMPVTLQARQVPVHAVPQHTPSTQMPELQSLLVAHFVPLPSEPWHVLVPTPVQR
jgi:hypothetical protein